MIIKILGPGCAKCKTIYSNVLEAIKELGIQADIVKIEDMKEIMSYNVLTTPVLMVDDVALVKGRVADVNEIKKLLTK
ncbi:MAG: thioredoxin family protein [Sediminibacterium sp.]|nr:thioredoxin family protein [Sediminibacterium sp.]